VERRSRIILCHYQHRSAQFCSYLKNYKSYEGDSCFVGSTIQFYMGIDPAIFKIQGFKNVADDNLRFPKLRFNGWGATNRHTHFFLNNLIFISVITNDILAHDKPANCMGGSEIFCFGPFSVSIFHAIAYISASGNIQKLGIRFSEPSHPN